MSRSICRCVRGVLVVVLVALAAIEQAGCRHRADDDAATSEARRRLIAAIADAWDQQAARDEQRAGDDETPAAPKPTWVAPDAQPVPSVTPEPRPIAVPEGPSPMDQARACLRSSSDMHASNLCVVNVLRGRCTTESEHGLLATTYRTMGRDADAVRCMREYIARYPSGARVGSFSAYIAGH